MRLLHITVASPLSSVASGKEKNCTAIFRYDTALPLQFSFTVEFSPTIHYFRPYYENNGGLRHRFFALRRMHHPGIRRGVRLGPTSSPQGRLQYGPGLIRTGRARRSQSRQPRRPSPGEYLDYLGRAQYHSGKLAEAK